MPLKPLEPRIFPAEWLNPGDFAVVYVPGVESEPLDLVDTVKLDVSAKSVTIVFHHRGTVVAPFGVRFLTHPH